VKPHKEEKPSPEDLGGRRAKIRLRSRGIIPVVVTRCPEQVLGGTKTVAMNDHFVREDLALPLRQNGCFALPAEEEDGEDPSERHVMDRPTASR
jgi:hypothetical protein